MSIVILRIRLNSGNLQKPKPKQATSEASPSPTSNPKPRETTPIPWQPLSPISAPRNLVTPESRRQAFVVDDDAAETAKRVLSFPEFKKTFKDLASPASKNVLGAALVAPSVTRGAGSLSDDEHNRDLLMTGAGGPVASSSGLYDTSDAINFGPVTQEGDLTGLEENWEGDKLCDESLGHGNHDQGLPRASPSTTSRDKTATTITTVPGTTTPSMEGPCSNPSTPKNTAITADTDTVPSPPLATADDNNVDYVIIKDDDDGKDDDYRSDTTYGEIPPIEEVVAQYVARKRQAQRQISQLSQSQSQSQSQPRPLPQSQSQSQSQTKFPRNRRGKARVDYRRRWPGPYGVFSS